MFVGSGVRLALDRYGSIVLKKSSPTLGPIF